MQIWVILGGISILAALFYPFDERISTADNLLNSVIAVQSVIYAKQPPRSDLELARLRGVFHAFTWIPLPGGVVAKEIDVAVSDNGTIPCYVFWPSNKGEETLPVIVSFHWGGFVLGHHYDPVVLEMVDAANAVVVSVGYRLAPEHKFPLGMNDCWDALLWVRANAQSIGGDPDRIAVAGASAGGNLAAVIAQRARDEGLKLMGQAVMVPMMRFGAQTRSHYEYGDLPGLTTSAVVWYWTEYVDKLEDCNNPYCQPVLAKSLKGVAPAVVLTGNYDVLRDEGEEYVQMLKRDNVSLVHFKVDGTHMGALALDWDARWTVGNELGKLLRA